jgi:hypothetical protein
MRECVVATEISNGRNLFAIFHRIDPHERLIPLRPALLNVVVTA